MATTWALSFSLGRDFGHRSSRRLHSQSGTNGMTSDRGWAVVTPHMHTAPQHKDVGGTDGTSASEPMIAHAIHPRVTACSVGAKGWDVERPTPIGEVARRWQEVKSCGVPLGGPGD